MGCVTAANDDASMQLCGECSVRGCWNAKTGWNSPVEGNQGVSQHLSQHPTSKNPLGHFT